MNKIEVAAKSYTIESAPENGLGVAYILRGARGGVLEAVRFSKSPKLLYLVNPRTYRPGAFSSTRLTEVAPGELVADR